MDSRCSHNCLLSMREHWPPSDSVLLVAPAPRILEESQPRRGPQPRGPLEPFLRSIGPLPGPDGDPLRVWHDSHMSAVFTAQPDDGLWRAVRIEGVLFCGRARIVHVAHRHEMLLVYELLHRRIWEVVPTLTMRHPDSQGRALHVPQPHLRCRGLFHPHCDEARLESPAPIMHKARLLLQGQCISGCCDARDPAQKR